MNKNVFKRFLESVCVCARWIVSGRESVPGSGASVRERTLAKLRSQSRS